MAERQAPQHTNTFKVIIRINYSGRREDTAGPVEPTATVFLLFYLTLLYTFVAYSLSYFSCTVINNV